MANHLTGAQRHNNRQDKIWEIYKRQQVKYRIQRKDGTYLNAGTDSPSWFTLETARKTVDREAGQRIVEHNGVDILWEVF